MVNSVPFGTSAMEIIGLGTDRLRLKLRVMSDQDLWTLFVHHREECSGEFWEEVENRKAVRSGRWANTPIREAPATIPT